MRRRRELGRGAQRFRGAQRLVVGGQGAGRHLLLGDLQAAGLGGLGGAGHLDPRPALAGDLELLRQDDAAVERRRLLGGGRRRCASVPATVGLLGSHTAAVSRRPAAASTAAAAWRTSGLAASAQRTTVSAFCGRPQAAAAGAVVSELVSAKAARASAQATTSVAATIWRFMGSSRVRVTGGRAGHHAPAVTLPLGSLREDGFRDVEDVSRLRARRTIVRLEPGPLVLFGRRELQVAAALATFGSEQPLQA